MRLNKFQKAWIAKLKSGTSRKYKGALRAPDRGAYCCLGVACNLAGLIPPEDATCLIHYPDVMNELKLRSSLGEIAPEKVKKEWRFMLNLVDDDGLPTTDCLASINDYGKVSHKKIGEFINANRSAVFVG